LYSSVKLQQISRSFNFGHSSSDPDEREVIKMSKGKVTQFCVAYRKFWKNPTVRDIPKLLVMLNKMTPKQVDSACRNLEKDGIEVGAADLTGETSTSNLFAGLAKLSNASARRYQKNRAVLTKR